MKTIGMPAGMWLLFAGSFRKKLIETLGYDAIRAREITSKAKREYKRIIQGLPEFEKGEEEQPCLYLEGLSPDGSKGIQRARPR